MSELKNSVAPIYFLKRKKIAAETLQANIVKHSRQQHVAFNIVTSEGVFIQYFARDQVNHLLFVRSFGRFTLRSNITRSCFKWCFGIFVQLTSFRLQLNSLYVGSRIYIPRFRKFWLYKESYLQLRNKNRWKSCRSKICSADNCFSLNIENRAVTMANNIQKKTMLDSRPLSGYTTRKLSLAAVPAPISTNVY